MPRPTNKLELLSLSEKNFKALNNLVDSFSVAEQNKEFPKGTMNRNIRDVLAHLYHWHLLMAEWYNIGMKGALPEVPAKGYTWKTTPDLNKKIWETYRATDLKNARRQLTMSNIQMMELIGKHSNEELFEKKRYKWTGTTSLGAYFISATSSHYDWAFRLIKKAMK
ncbi:MAG: ClbS/DfsB family four-helix bundle protein [Bacteroidetes bacterium]|nr:ClbS/DfsB family four-helix bundle protein [Bacteroidota bacterium]